MVYILLGCSCVFQVYNLITTEFFGDLVAVDVGVFFNADFKGFSCLIPFRSSLMLPPAVLGVEGAAGGAREMRLDVG